MSTKINVFKSLATKIEHDTKFKNQNKILTFIFSPLNHPNSKNKKTKLISITNNIIDNIRYVWEHSHFLFHYKKIGSSDTKNRRRCTKECRERISQRINPHRDRGRPKHVGRSWTSLDVKRSLSLDAYRCVESE